MRVKRSFLAGTALASCLVAVPAFAQSDPATAQAETATPASPSPSSGPGDAGRSALVPLEAQAADAGSIGDIVVTARRRDESLQSVPVTVSAFGANALRERSIVSVQDLQTQTPGVFLGGSGSSSNTMYVIRGQGRPTVGVGQPGAITYFADVPLPTQASNQPQYDMSSIQILKGPQGTLFGRNTTGGAVLTYPQLPTYEFGGYAQAGIGNYDLRDGEAALNVPIVDDQIALRVAGRFTKRDGYVESIGVGRALGELDNHAVRGALLLEPLAGVRNVTLVDYYKTDEVGTPKIFVGFFPGTLLANLAGFTNPSLNNLLAQQQANGIRKTFSDIDALDQVEALGITNRTDIELGSVSVTNIFGYRKNDWRSFSNFDGLPAVDLDGPGPGTAGPVLNTYRQLEVKQLTEELQIKGTLFEEKLDWLVGGFYLKSDPNGPNFDRADFFGVRRGAYTFLSERSKALFANFSYDLDALVKGLKVNVGGRYTWDSINVCSGLTEITMPYLLEQSDCKAGALANNSDLSSKFEKPTWTVGLDWQASRDLFLYLTSRRGYRAGGINAPRLGSRLAPFQSFKPETVTDVELGVRSDWKIGDVAVRFNGSAFYSRSKGVQYVVSGLTTGLACNPVTSFDGDCDTSNDPNSGSLTINAGTTRVQGIEASLTVAPTSRLSFDAGFSHLDPKTLKTTYGSFSPLIIAVREDPNKIPFRFFPKTTFTGHVRYRLPVSEDIGKLVLNADYYHSSSILYGLYTAPSYGIFNARLDLNDVGGRPVDVSVFARNIFEKRYVFTPGAIGINPGSISLAFSEPRMYGLQVRLRFGDR